MVCAASRAIAAASSLITVFLTSLPATSRLAVGDTAMAEDVRLAGGGWALRTICVLGAAAMAAAAVYLFEPGLADLGFYVERGKYALAGYTLIYAALLVGFAATAGALRTGHALVDYALSFAAGPFALFALGFLFSALAVDAYVYRDPANYWVTLLAAPAALCFVAASLSEFAGRQAEASLAASGASRGALAGLLFVAFSFTAALAAVVIYINAGYLLFYLLQANLLDGSDIDLSRVGPALVTLLAQVVVERWQFVVIMGTVGALLIYGFTALSGMRDRASLGKRPALSSIDEAYVARCADALRAYADERGYAKNARRWLWLVALPSLLAPMMLASVVGFNLHNWVPRPYALEDLNVLGWHVYERTIGASAIAILSAGILWGVLPNAIIARLWRGYSEMAGWSGFATGQVTPEPYLRMAVSSGALSPEQPFEPGYFLHRLNTRHEPYFLFPAVLMSLAAGIAWHHDMSRYHVLTGKYVEVMSYWTLERQRYPYNAVRGIELECLIDDGRLVASYEIMLPDGYSVDLFDKKSFADHVNDLARVDALVPASVPRTFATRKGQSAFDPICVEALAAALPEEDAGRLRAVFRTEAWHRARWRERIGVAK
jgi:hypothetical protein